jgi:hypothetical protein
MEIFNIMLMVSVAVYSILGLKNWITRLIVLFTSKAKYIQSPAGKVMDMAWLLSIIYLYFVLKYGTENVVAFLVGLV